VNYGFEDIWIKKLDENLEIVWSKIFGTDGNDRIWRSVESPDGSIVLVGFVQLFSDDSVINDTHLLNHNGDFDLLVMKLNPSGDLQWAKTYGGAEHDEGRDILSLPNGDVLVCGYTESTNGDITENKGERDLWVIRLDSNGEIIWQKTYGGNDDEEARSMIAKDNEVWITGYSKSDDGDVSENFGTRDIWLLAINPDDGALRFEKSFGSNVGDVGVAIRDFNNAIGEEFFEMEFGDQYFILGQSSSPDRFGENQGQDDIVLLRIDENGEEVWSESYGGTQTDIPRDLLFAPLIEGDIVGVQALIVGSTFSVFSDKPFLPDYATPNGISRQRNLDRLVLLKILSECLCMSSASSFELAYRLATPNRYTLN